MALLHLYNKHSAPQTGIVTTMQPQLEQLARSQIESGLQAQARGDFGLALSAYRQALAMAPEFPDALNLMGAALLQLGQPAEAVDCLERAARRLRNNPGVLGNLAQAYFALGQYEQAREAFRRASRLDPRAVHFQLGVANSLAMQGKLGDAEILLRKQAVRFPNEALVWHNLGNVLRDLQRPAEAAECYRNALALDPQLIDARNNLGGALQTLGKFEEAELEYRACLAQAPDHAMAQCNLALVTIDLGRFSEAEAMCRNAITRTPAMSEAHSFLGTALGHQGRQQEALACHRTAAGLAPDNAKVIEGYAATLMENGEVDEGLRWFSSALALQPDSVSLHQRLAYALLAHGQLAAGWAEYLHRPAFIENRKLRADLKLCRALPHDLNGKHVCLVNEQGPGDEIFFLRFAPLLAARGARITYRSGNKILSLLKRVACIDQVLDETAPLPAADSVLMLGDLPHALNGYGVGTPPSLVLPPLAARLAEVRERLAEAGSPPYIGLTWRGGTPPGEQRNAANWVLHKKIEIVPLAAALRQVPGTFIALQRNPAPGEIEEFVHALGRSLHDFCDLNEDLESMLALLALIDDYIGVSNTNMHLRAAAGKTAHVLVPRPAEWRWLASGDASPWFPGFWIYRQSLDGDWNAAFAKLAQTLGERNLGKTACSA